MKYLVLFIWGLTAFSNAFADLGPDYENLGEFKDSWKSNWIHFLGSELYDETQTKNRLFKDLNLELDVSINRYGKAAFHWDRRVTNHLPAVDNYIIKNEDYSKYRVVNSFLTRIDASVGYLDYFSSGANAGIYFGVARSVHPNNSSLKPKAGDDPKDVCEDLSDIIDFSDKEAYRVEAVNCKNTTRSRLQRSAENILNAIGGGLSFILQPFNENQKSDIWLKDPFEALKLHMRFGLPLKPEVFYEDNLYLSVGDVVKHSTFFSLTPVSIGKNLLGVDMGTSLISAGLKTNVSKFHRFVRDLSIKKLAGNKVTLEVDDFIYRGNDYTWLQFRPRFLRLFSYTFLDWSWEPFHEEALKRTYQVDLNTIGGRFFFNKVIKLGYVPQIKIDSSGRLVEDLPDEGIIAETPVYITSERADYLELFRLPGVFKYRNDDNRKVEKIEVGKKSTQIRGVRHHRKEREFKYNFLFFDKTNYYYSCSLNTKSEMTPNQRSYNSILMSSGISLNFNCSYNNKEGRFRNVKNVVDTLEIALNQKIPYEHKSKLYKETFNEGDDVQLTFQLSFGKDQIQNILGAKSDNEILEVISRVLLGENTSFVWNIDNIKAWDRISRENRRNVVFPDDHYLKHACSRNSNAVVKPGKGITSIDYRDCSAMYRKVVREAFHMIKDIQNAKSIKSRIKSLNETFPSLEWVGFLQNTMVRLAGGLSNNNVRYYYYINTSTIDSPIEGGNGILYDYNLSNIVDKVPNIEAIGDDKGRIKSATFWRKKSESAPKYGETKELILEIESDYQFAKDSNKTIKVEIREFEILKDIHLATVYRSVPSPIIKNIGSGKREYLYRVSIPWDKKLRAGKTHSALIKVINPKGEWLTEEAQVLFAVPSK